MDNANSLRPLLGSVKTVEKSWGKEEWLANNQGEGYCAKYLYINAGHKFSMHMHVLKAETFILVNDAIAQLLYVDTELGEERSMDLVMGVPVDIPRFMPHSVKAITDTVVLEVSTFHRDDDSYRMYK